MKNTDNLKKALNSFLKENDSTALALIMARAEAKGLIAYEDIENLIEGDIEDILLLAFQWRLLLPVRAAKAGDWEDRMLIPGQGEQYRMPNVITCLVKNALVSGKWDPENAIIDVFRNIGEPDIEKMPVLFERIASKVKGRRINGVQIKSICRELGLEARIDPLVSELKACGILSHKLTSLTEVSRAGTPLYEVNPALLVG